MSTPWDKSIDEELAELPDSYLTWITQNYANKELVAAANKEYKYRADNGLLSEHWWELTIGGLRYGKRELD